MIQTEKSHLPVAAITHPGMKGKVNEDRFGVAAFHLGKKNSTPVLLAVLSDGIGGHRAGEVASEMAVNLISRKIAESDGVYPVRILQEAVKYASGEIFTKSQSNPDFAGMGATCACVWVIDRQLYAATVGDSRIYLIRGARIYQLSTDHTWIQEALEMGLINKEEAAGHPNAHIIRRYLGSMEPPAVDLRMRLGHKESDTQAMSNQGMPLRNGDILVLCSDGLTDLVNDEEINSTFSEYEQNEAVQRLVDLANERGGHDNITLLGIQVPGTAPKPRPWRTLAFSLAGILAVAALAGVAIAGWLWTSGFNLAGGSLTPETPTGLAATLPVSSPAAGGQATQVQAQASAAPLEMTATPARPTLPPFAPAAGGATLTPWPTNTRQPTFTPLPTQPTPTPQPSIGP